MFDYMALKMIWLAIMCFIVIAFAITGGMDIGVNFLLFHRKKLTKDFVNSLKKILIKTLV